MGDGVGAGAECGEVDTHERAKQSVLLGVIGSGAAVIGWADHYGAAKVGGAIFSGKKQSGDEAAHGVSDEVELCKTISPSGTEFGGEEFVGDSCDG